MSTVKFIQGHIPIVPFFFQLTDTHHNYHKNEKIYEITNNTTKKIKSFSSHISSLPRISQFREKEKTENNLIFPKNLTKRKKIQYSNIKKENSFIYQQNFDNLNSLQEISISDLNKNKFWQQVLEHKILNENNSHRKTMKQINSFCTNEKKIEKNYLKKKEDLYFEKRELMTRKSLYSSNIHVKFHRNQNSLSLQDQEYLELNILSQKIMKRIRKILKMNTNNISKTYFELIKIVDNKKLNELLFWERHKKINPKLNESFILRSLFIAPITYNSPNQERLEKNEEMIELFRNLDIKLKDLIFKKKIQIYSLEKSNILALNQKLYDRENDLISKLNNQKKKIDIRKKLAKFENLQQLIGRRCNPLDLLSHVREFEDKYGKLDLLDEKTRIIGKEIDSIIKEVHLDLRNIDEKDKNIFFSIDNNSFDHYLPK